MRKVFLHGELGNSLGKEWELEVDSVQAALCAIEANTNRLVQFMMKNAKKFTHYTIAIDDKDLIEHQLKSPIADDNRAIHIMPQMAGGVEWVVYIVVAIVIGLVMQNIFKPPKPKDAIETNSYLFAGTQNVAAQGVPVPLGYGRLRVGSVVLSAAVRHVEYAPKADAQEVVGPHGPYFVGKPIGRNRKGYLYSEVGQELLKSGVTNYELGTLNESQAVYSEEFDIWYYPDELFWDLVNTGGGYDWFDPGEGDGWGPGD